MAGGQESGRLAGAGISPTSLQFADRRIEAAFVAHQARRFRSFVRIWSVCGIAAYLAFGLAEQAMTPEAVAISFRIRYGLAMPVFLACFCWTFLPDPYQRFSSHLISLCVAISHASMLMVIMLAGPARIDLYFLFILLSMLFTHGAIGVRFTHSALVTWLAVAAFAAVSSLFAPPVQELGETLMQNVTLLLASSVVVFGNYNFELQARRDFRHALLLQEKNLELDRLAREAAEASAAKSRFLGMMSHELRTPLNAIIGFADLIARGAQGAASPAIYADYARDIHQGGLRLLASIDAVLDLARAAEGGLRLQEDMVRLDKLLRKVADRYRPRAREAGMSLELRGDPSLRLLCDRTLLRRAIGNLVDNAIKHAASGGLVSIEARQLEDGALAIAVADRGPGMSGAEFRAALEPFRQADDGTARRQEGLGLGLSVTRVLVELHGGRLRLTGSSAPGLAVEIVLPPTRIFRERAKPAA
ncbi:MAG: HAMP domain-containing histidine kinase [Alphaproteobacteria bacterium]|nr:HAMP domain-containing histidine kinase [Alphaproteobacteria bacterium]